MTAYSGGVKIKCWAAISCRKNGVGI